MSVLYPKACPGSHRSRALALWLPQCRGDLPSNIPHTTPSSRFKNRTVQYSTFIRLYWYTSREFRTRFARLMPCTIPSDSPAINFVSKRPWQTFLQTAISSSTIVNSLSPGRGVCPAGGGGVCPRLRPRSPPSPRRIRYVDPKMIERAPID